MPPREPFRRYSPQVDDRSQHIPSLIQINSPT